MEDKHIFETIMKEASTGRISNPKQLFDLLRKHVRPNIKDTRCASCIRSFLVELKNVFDKMEVVTEPTLFEENKFDKLKKKVPKIG
jgi:hypothetical protein